MPYLFWEDRVVHLGGPHFDDETRIGIACRSINCLKLLGLIVLYFALLWGFDLQWNGWILERVDREEQRRLKRLARERWKNATFY